MSVSVNALLKRKVDYKCNELLVFMEKLKGLIKEQDKEIARSVIGRGKYIVDPKYKKFIKTEDDWSV